MNRFKKVGIMCLALMLIGLFFLTITGCGSGGGSGPIVIGNTSALLRSFTSNSGGSISEFIFCELASNDDLSGLDEASLFFPDDTVLGFDPASGSITANNYFYGNSTINRGSLSDPFSETYQRQLYAEATYAPPIDGVYTVQLNDTTQDMVLAQSDYLDPILQSDVTTNSGAGLLNVTAGDTITVLGANNSNLRYFCRIYDTQAGQQTVQKYWTSADVRGLDWTNTDGLFNFFTYATTMPASGQVQFTIPAAVLSKGTNNLRVLIDAYDVTTMYSDTSGAIDTFTWSTSEVRFNLSGI